MAHQKTAVIVFTGDLIRSRNMPDRHHVQNRLKEVLERLKEDNKSIIASHTMISQGDEFQVAYSNANRLFRDIWTILAELSPEKARFSIAVSSLSTEIDPDSTRSIDGPAFHYSREGITQLKEQKKKAGKLACVPLFIISGDISQRDLKLINSALMLLSSLCHKWKQSRWCILVDMMRNQSVETIAKRLDISSTAVYKNITDGSLHHVIELGKSIEQVLNEAENRS